MRKLIICVQPLKIFVKLNVGYREFVPRILRICGEARLNQLLFQFTVSFRHHTTMRGCRRIGFIVKPKNLSLGYDSVLNVDGQIKGKMWQTDEGRDVNRNVAQRESVFLCGAAAAPRAGSRFPHGCSMSVRPYASLLAIIVRENLQMQPIRCRGFTSRSLLPRASCSANARLPAYSPSSRRIRGPSAPRACAVRPM